MDIRKLWESAAPASELLDLHREDLPETARRYLNHAIAPGAIAAHAVRLRMHGEMKIKGWATFTAEQVISPERGMIWNAKTKMAGLPTSGSDSILDRVGSSRWKLLGLIPIANMRGKDVDHSAGGRMAAEFIWLPSVLARRDVQWLEIGPDEVRATFTAAGFETDLDLKLTPDGRISQILFQRWGNPDGLPFAYHPFGGYVDEETTFGSFTIPSKMRMGWHFGTDRFESEGEFFRAMIDAAEYR